MAQPVYLSLGSNLGVRESNLQAAVSRLEDVMRIDAVSGLYETRPVGVVDQPEFLNLAVAGTTTLGPGELLRSIKEIERGMGRRPTFRWGPRIIDIDIVLYGDVILKTPDLTIPHPRMAERPFVLAPLAEIAGDVVDPRSKRSVRELWESHRASAGVRKREEPSGELT